MIMQVPEGMSARQRLTWALHAPFVRARVSTTVKSSHES
jgi:hypothetical protein